MTTPVHLACLDQGDGPVVVLVHGFPIDGSMWYDTGAILAGSCRVLVPDQRGFGRSPATPHAALADYADDLARLLDRYHIDRPALLAGLSFGGHVVMECMRRHPGRLDAVGLINTRELPDTSEAAAARRASADAIEAGGPVSAVTDPMLPRLLAPNAAAEMLAHWGPVLRAQPRVGVAAALRALAGRPDSTETLRSFRGRALVVGGEHDAITPPDIHERMAAALPRAELHIVPDAGHMTPTEQPAAFAAIVRGFLGLA